MRFNLFFLSAPNILFALAYWVELKERGLQSWNFEKIGNDLSSLLDQHRNRNISQSRFIQVSMILEPGYAPLYP